MLFITSILIFQKFSVSLLLIAIIIASTKADGGVPKPVDPSNKDKAIAEAKVEFTDGIEMQIKKVTSADGKEISILIKKEVLPDTMVAKNEAPKSRRRREVADNVMDLEKLKNDKNFKKETIKDAEGNDVEVYVLNVLEHDDEKKSKT